MTAPRHPCGLTSHPEWPAVRARYDAMWVRENIEPYPPAEDDDHDEPEARDPWPGIIGFVVFLGLGMAAVISQVLA